MKASAIGIVTQLLDQRVEYLEAIERLKSQSTTAKVLLESVYTDKWRAVSFLQEEIRFVDEQLKTLGVEI